MEIKAINKRKNVIRIIIAVIMRRRVKKITVKIMIIILWSKMKKSKPHNSYLKHKFC